MFLESSTKIHFDAKFKNFSKVSNSVLLKTPFMKERNQKINSKWNIVDNKSVVYNINIDKKYMRAEQEESEGRLAAASL